jgi:hypothetical protein
MHALYRGRQRVQNQHLPNEDDRESSSSDDRSSSDDGEESSDDGEDSGSSSSESESESDNDLFDPFPMRFSSAAYELEQDDEDSSTTDDDGEDNDDDSEHSSSDPNYTSDSDQQDYSDSSDQNDYSGDDRDESNEYSQSAQDNHYPIVHNDDDNNYDSFDPSVTVVYQRRNQTVVQRLHDWMNTAEDFSKCDSMDIENPAPSSYNSSATRQSFDSYMSRLRRHDFIKSIL